MMSRVLPCFLLCLVAACASTKKEPPPKPFAMTKWEVVLERETAPQHVRPWVAFADGMMEGFAGCNPVTARYVQDSVGARAIAIGRISVERGGCDVRSQLIQTHILEVLQAVSSYTITQDVMTMSGSAGTLTFRAAAEPAAVEPAK
ncbi:MAG TPA: META domain-containing protein [Usitatibacter sp.]|jgi:heat shock protein HslJ|nr:META domain-containing protein [Usitatibacter sp.]